MHFFKEVSKWHAAISSGQSHPPNIDPAWPCRGSSLTHHPDFFTQGWCQCQLAQWNAGRPQPKLISWDLLHIGGQFTRSLVVVVGKANTCVFPSECTVIIRNYLLYWFVSCQDLNLNHTFFELNDANSNLARHLHVLATARLSGGFTSVLISLWPFGVSHLHLLHRLWVTHIRHSYF